MLIFITILGSLLYFLVLLILLARVSILAEHQRIDSLNRYYLFGRLTEKEFEQAKALIWPIILTVQPFIILIAIFELIWGKIYKA